MDVDDFDEAKKLVKELKDYVGFFKVGLQLYTSVSFDVIKMIHDEGGKVFLTANSTIYQTPLQEPALTLSKGYKLFDVHIKGGSKMLSTTVKLACETAKNIISRNL